MIKEIQAIVFFMAVFCGSTMAIAEDIKMYMGIGLGSFSADYGSSVVGKIKSDGKLGSYLTVSADATPYVAAEFRYGLVGKSTVKRNGATWAGNSVTISNIGSAFIKPQFPLGKYGHVYGMLGFTSVTLDYDNAGLVTSTKESDLSYGVGFNVHIANTWAIAADYVRYTGKQGFAIKQAQVTGFSVNINYMFD